MLCILCSADKQMEQSAIKLGVVDFLDKPCTLDGLGASLQKAIKMIGGTRLQKSAGETQQIPPTMKTEPIENRRRYPRVPSKANTIAGIRLQYQGGDFAFDETAVVLNECTKGCCLVVPSKLNLMIGEVIWVKLGNKSPAQAEIRWITYLDSDVARIGLFCPTLEYEPEP